MSNDLIFYRGINIPAVNITPNDMTNNPNDPTNIVFILSSPLIFSVMGCHIL